MHDVMKHLNVNIALPEEHLQHGVNIYITVPWIDGTINCEYCYVPMAMPCQLYSIYEVLSLQLTASNKI